ncbi:hypothetical protein GCM10023205_80420 [Yinghuangia aomiensis]|uniref:Uncharacterized protein n=2 Tax=Yinghuangia aomiensis TaxID=676205 RepID=A0ABP9IDC4_9ACTN
MFYKRFGFYAAGPEAIFKMLDQMIYSQTPDLESGAVFRVMVEDHYDKVRSIVEDWGVQILYASDGELLIGDNPALSIRRSEDPASPPMQVPIGEAEIVFMPISPKHLLCLGGQTESGDLDANSIFESNQLQLLYAHSEAYFRPESGLEDFALRFCQHTARSPEFQQGAHRDS